MTEQKFRLYRGRRFITQRRDLLGKTLLTLTRRIAERKPSQADPEKGPFRVLLFTSLPEDVDPEKGRLNVEEEQAPVPENWRCCPTLTKGVVQLEMPDDGRFST